MAYTGLRTSCRVKCTSHHSLLARSDASTCPTHHGRSLVSVSAMVTAHIAGLSEVGYRADDSSSKDASKYSRPQCPSHEVMAINMYCR